MSDTVRVERTIAYCSPEAAFDFVLDVGRYPALMPNVRCVRILEESGGTRITRWETELEGAPLIWTESDTIRERELRIEFTAIEGDFDLFQGWWEVVPPSRTEELRVVCQLRYSMGIPVIEEIVGPILKTKICENLEIMLGGLARGIERSILALAPLGQ